MEENTNEMHTKDFFEAKDYFKKVVESETYSEDLLKHVFNLYHDKLPMLFSALTELVKEYQKANKTYVDADKESTSDYFDILNDQLKFLRERCKSAKTQEELDDLHKQMKDILDRLREEKHEQRKHVETLDGNQKNTTLAVTGVLATAASLALAFVFRDKIKLPGK